jgi:scyllo-inositol 2-dehydrogenase (NADP+)
MAPEAGPSSSGGGPATGAVTAFRTALIGYGVAGEFFHAPLIAAETGLVLATVVTGDAERAARARERHPGIAVVEAADELWRSPEEHDLVVVAAPNRAHVPLARAALGAGLHVVVDKPLAVRAEDGRALGRAAEEAGRTLAVFQNRRYDGDFLTLRRLMEEDALGSVHRFESRFERWRPQLREGAWRERGGPEDAGGVLYDLGSHLIDQALTAFGPVRSVYAELDRRRRGAEADDDDFVALSHHSEVRSHLWMSHTAAIVGPRMRALGASAAYVKWGLDPQEDALRAGAVPGGQGWGAEPPERWGLLGVDGDAHPVATEPGDYPRFYRELAEALHAGAPPPATATEAVATLEVIEAAMDSARTRAVVPVVEA